MAKDQQTRNEQWAKENREHKRYLSKRSTARSFIRKDAIESDLIELKKIIEKRMIQMKPDVKLYFFAPMPGSAYSGILIYLDDPISEYGEVAEPHFPAAIDRAGRIEYRMIQDDGELLQIYEYAVSDFDKSIVYQDAGGREQLIVNLKSLKDSAKNKEDESK